MLERHKLIFKGFVMFIDFFCIYYLYLFFVSTTEYLFYNLLCLFVHIILFLCFAMVEQHLIIMSSLFFLWHRLGLGVLIKYCWLVGLNYQCSNFSTNKFNLMKSKTTYAKLRQWYKLPLSSSGRFLKIKMEIKMIEWIKTF